MLRRVAGSGAIAMAGVILVGTLTPLLAGEGDRCLLRVPCTLGHTLVFGGLGVALAGLYATSAFARRSPQRALVMLLLALWVFAALTELAQGQIGRDASVADWAADMAGAVGGLLAGGLALRLLWGSRLAVAAAEPLKQADSGRPRKARR